MDLICEIENRVSIFNNLYDSLRVVDPINNQIISASINKTYEKDIKCYSVWKKNTSCENCISMRAYLNNDTFIKIEYNKARIILIAATPIKVYDNTFVVEFIKDISNNGSIGNNETKYDFNMKNFINSFNESVARDKLTGAYNKNHFYERLAIDKNYNKINKLSLSIILTEINDFKKIKNKYGDNIGDKVLVYFINLIQASIRKKTDWVCRYDESKFIIVLNDTQLNDTNRVIKTIREQLQENKFEYEETIINIKSSFHTSSINDCNIEVSELLLKADNNSHNLNVNNTNKAILNKDDVNQISTTNLDIKGLKLAKLNNKINELRETLNEICITCDSNETQPNRLFISQCLDELIVQYMKELNG